MDFIMQNKKVLYPKKVIDYLSQVSQQNTISYYYKNKVKSS